MVKRITIYTSGKKIKSKNTIANDKSLISLIKLVAIPLVIEAIILTVKVKIKVKLLDFSLSFKIVCSFKLIYCIKFKKYLSVKIYL
ncbi:MAG: hypothetical protein ACLRRH_07045 [Clostridium sp.]